jgi:hypothetical protein
MNVGDMVYLAIGGITGIAKIVEDRGFGFYGIVLEGDDKIRMIYSDYIKVISESR